MKKLFERKWLIVGGFVVLLFFYLGCDRAWDGFTHKGKGYVTYGDDDEPILVSQSEYRKHERGNAIVMFLMSWAAIYCVYKTWIEENKKEKEQKDLEKHWRETIKNEESLADIHKNPSWYRDDFKAWIKKNYPHLAVWELPKNSSN